MKTLERERALKNIRESRFTSVILISLMAGGEGLNLVSCNNVIFLDLWWNPAVEVKFCSALLVYDSVLSVFAEPSFRPCASHL